MTQDFQAIMHTPFAALGIRVLHGQLTGIDFLPGDAAAMEPQGPVAKRVCAALENYLHNPSAKLDLPICPAGTNFQQRVWQALRNIPAGTTITYSQLAVHVLSGARAVAKACGANPIPLVIPCHRVVAKHGLGGFMQGRASESLAIKQWLLAHERSGPRAA
jgi:methylated-DNA-[protein]-cysteine S-methyltransferase